RFRQAMRERGPGWMRRGKNLAVQFIEAREVGGVADVIAGLHDVLEVAAGRLEDAAQVADRPLKLPVEGVRHDFSGLIDRSLPGDEDHVAHPHGWAERQVRGGGVGCPWIRDGGAHEKTNPGVAMSSS